MTSGDFWTLLAMLSLALALLPLLLGLSNLYLYRAPREVGATGPVAVSVLIPARNEAATIGTAVEAALASRGLDLEVIVLDDHSTDGTAAAVEAIARRDPRLRLESAPPLPPGWAGKQHACHVLAGLARFPVLLFQDADVRLAPQAVERIAGFLLAGRAGLVSGFPRQRTETLAEAMIVPLIQFLLIGYLPMLLMRSTLSPGASAGCGQLIAVRRDDYALAGGHASIRASLHDGIMLPRAFRRVGLWTDLFDATELADCRMYSRWSDLWQGFLKNATEGMATPRALPLWTVLLFGGHVLPWLLLPFPGAAPAALAAVAAGMAFRLLLAVRFRQSLAGAILHPIGILLLLAIQWHALLRAARRRPAYWKGRTYPSDTR